MGDLIGPSFYINHYTKQITYCNKTSECYTSKFKFQHSQSIINLLSIKFVIFIFTDSFKSIKFCPHQIFWFIGQFLQVLFCSYPYTLVLCFLFLDNQNSFPLFYGLQLSWNKPRFTSRALQCSGSFSSPSPVGHLKHF